MVTRSTITRAMERTLEITPSEMLPETFRCLDWRDGYDHLDVTYDTIGANYYDKLL